jgi:hypothetical protein
MGLRSMFDGRAPEPGHYYCHACVEELWNRDVEMRKSESATNLAHLETRVAVDRGEGKLIVDRRVDAWRSESSHPKVVPKEGTDDGSPERKPQKKVGAKESKQIGKGRGSRKPKGKQ